MKEYHFTPDEFPSVALLIKDKACSYDLLYSYYVRFINSSVVALSLEYPDNNKITAAIAKEYLQHILPILNENNIKTLYVADSAYFKFLTKKAKTEPCYGYVIPCAIKNFEHINIIYGVNYQALFHNPALQDKLDLSLKTLNSWLQGTYTELGHNIIHSAYYPETLSQVETTLSKLHQHSMLSCDIETYGLDLAKAVPATISFAWNQHEGIAFRITDENIPAIKKFFCTYSGTTMWHNATFDIRCIVYHLFMQHPLDYEGMIQGLDVMYRKVHDTKLIAYLATNSTTGNNLSLKAIAFEFAGDYAQEQIHDITQIPEKELLEYNLVDALSTHYAYSKHYPTLIQDNQLDIYKNLFIPALKNITQMELVGMPMDMSVVDTLDQELNDLREQHNQVIQHSQLVKDFEWALTKEEFVNRNKALKRKVVSLDDCKVLFNPGSTVHLTKLLYDHIGFDVIDTTDTGLPATGNKTVKKLISQLKTKFNISDEEYDAL